MYGLSERDLREFYWEAMAKRWTNGVKKINHTAVPNHDSFVFMDADLLLVETFCENSLTNELAGMINVFHEEQPVWTFHYYGFCDKQAESFLANVLSKAYRERTSLGGRGPEKVEGKKYVYFNPRQFGPSIDRIQGTERIVKILMSQPQDRTLAQISFGGGFLEKISPRQ
jgi:hypothetical protein